MSKIINQHSHIIPQEISMLVSSNPINGARNISSDGSYFEIQLQDGLKIPRNAINVNISVEEASIWWVVPNIITGENDKLYITGPDNNNNQQNFILTIPQGLYDLTGLNNAIVRELENNNAKTDSVIGPLIQLVADQATQKVILRVNYVNTSVDFTQTKTCREILGFNSQVIGPFISVPQNPVANNTANFNLVNYFLIHSDLTNKGIRFNNDYNQTISQVLIDVPPGSQIVNKPFNPAKISSEELKGTIRTNLRFWITDDKNKRVNTNGEYWSARIVISYSVPLTIETIKKT
jgi:hypothetical protein